MVHSRKGCEGEQQGRLCKQVNIVLPSAFAGPLSACMAALWAYLVVQLCCVLAHSTKQGATWPNHAVRSVGFHVSGSSSGSLLLWSPPVSIPYLYPHRIPQESANSRLELSISDYALKYSLQAFAC